MNFENIENIDIMEIIACHLDLCSFISFYTCNNNIKNMLSTEYKKRKYKHVMNTKYLYIQTHIFNKIKADDPSYKLKIIKDIKDIKDINIETNEKNKCTCGFDNINFRFGVRNINNSKDYLIGSKCIKSINECINMLNLSNDDKILFNELFFIYYKQKIKCPCGLSFFPGDYNAHKKLKKHIRYENFKKSI